MLKVKPPKEYPPEEGRYLRGDDYSPVAVVAILDTFDFKIPAELNQLVKVAIESGAALSGTLQTANIGLEKIIANIVANPNIRYVVVCGKEVEGHKAGDALMALIENGVNVKRVIVGTIAPTTYLFNIPAEAINRFRRQITIVNLINVVDPEVVKKAVWTCYQEKPTKFVDYKLYDQGAYPEPPICYKITWRIEKPQNIEEWEIDEEFIKKLEY